MPSHIPVAEIRLSLRLPQERFAKLLGVDFMTVSKWESGIVLPTSFQESLIRVAAEAVKNVPDVGTAISAELRRAGGVPRALFVMLSAAYREVAS